MDHFRRPVTCPGQAWTHLVASMACGVRGDLAEAVTQAEQTLVLFRRTGGQAPQGWALAALAECHARPGDYEPARALRPAGPGDESGDQQPIALA